MTLDEKLDVAGFTTITERLRCDGVMDGFARHAQVNTLDEFLKWIEMERRSNMEMMARNDLGIHKLSVDVEDFVLGKSAMLWEVHVNLLHVIRGLHNDKG